MNAIVRAGTLSQFIENATPLVVEAKIHFESRGAELKAVDPANVGMVAESLRSEGFESYEVDGSILGVSLVRLGDAIGLADKDDLVHLEYNEETRKLHIEVDGFEYTLALIDQSSIRQEPDIPPVEDELGATVVLEARQLSRAAKAADLVDDQVAFGASVDNEVVYAEATGDIDDMRLEWGRGDTLEGTKIEDDAFSRYSLDYLKDMLKPLDAGAEVTMRVGEGYPVFLESEFADGHGELRHMLAPKVTTSEGRR